MHPDETEKRNLFIPEAAREVLSNERHFHTAGIGKEIRKLAEVRIALAGLLRSIMQRAEIVDWMNRALGEKLPSNHEWAETYRQFQESGYAHVPELFINPFAKELDDQEGGTVNVLPD